MNSKTGSFKYLKICYSVEDGSEVLYEAKNINLTVLAMQFSLYLHPRCSLKCCINYPYESHIKTSRKLITQKSMLMLVFGGGGSSSVVVKALRYKPQNVFRDVWRRVRWSKNNVPKRRQTFNVAGT
jgi:hypothetical protein